MSRLKGMKCYLAGPIQCAFDFGHKWRDDITPFIENMGVTVFNPLEPIFDSLTNMDEIMRPHMAKLRDEERWDELRVEVKKVVRADLHMVDLSNFVIVNYDISTPMCGTYEELFTANRLNKPVLMVVKDKKKLPLWMYGRIPTRSHMFESWDLLKKYLSGINEDPDFKFEPADTKRWLFFSEQFKVEQFGENYNEGVKQ